MGLTQAILDGFVAKAMTSGENTASGVYDSVKSSLESSGIKYLYLYVRSYKTSGAHGGAKRGTGNDKYTSFGSKGTAIDDGVSWTFSADVVVYAG